MATASEEDGHGSEVAGAVHKVLATLTDLHTDTPVAELRERTTLVPWPHGELAAVEMLLTGAYGRRVAATADAGRGPGANG